MWTSYKELYDSIDNEKVLVDKRLELVRYANKNGIKITTRFYNSLDTAIDKYINISCSGKKNKKHVQTPKDISWKKNIRLFMYWLNV